MERGSNLEGTVTFQNSTGGGQVNVVSMGKRQTVTLEDRSQPKREKKVV